MDLIYTNAKKEDVGVLSAYSFDLSFGASENNFEMTIGTAEASLEYGAYIYIDGTEYGGITDAKITGTNAESVTYKGRTWHGIMNSKIIQPDSGQDYLIVSGDANEVLASMITRLGLSGLFLADEKPSGVNISRYQFNRYCKGYDGIKAMLEASGAKLKIAWENRAIVLCAVPIVDYASSPLDGDVAELTVEQHGKKVNHLVCLGRGDLAQREVIHLYADQNGEVVDTPYYTGMEEVAEVYDNSNSEDLRKDGIQKLKELRNVDRAEMDLQEVNNAAYDIGDIIGAMDMKTGISISTAVSQKIVRISNGVISTEYQTGG